MADAESRDPVRIDEPHTPGAAAARLAAALGWDELPAVSDEQRAKDLNDLEAALARRDAA
jgi:hypothetical protein